MCKSKKIGKMDILLGVQWGDEGKGKFVDALTPHYDVICRFQGGPNAGHTLEFNGIKHVLHIIPSGIFHPEKTNVIGNGVLIEPVILQQEIDELFNKGINAMQNLWISKKAHLILPTHRMMDAANEQSKGKGKIGSTLKGIGPAYTDKVARDGLRVGDIMQKDFLEHYKQLKSCHIMRAKSMGFDISDFNIGGMNLEKYEKLWLTSVERLKSFNLINSEYFINRCLDNGKRILAEGAQGTMLDIDFGTYPFVTSSSTITAGVCSGLGVAPSRIGRVIGITKAYCTRVGAGPFPTELFDETGEKLCTLGKEFGATTGRKRRCGWIDIPALKYACMINGVTDLIITKPDVMNSFDTIKMCIAYKIGGKRTEELPFEYCTADIEPITTEFSGWEQNIGEISNYEELPDNLKNYLEAIERLTEVKISAVSTSPDRKDVIWRINQQ